MSSADLAPQRLDLTSSRSSFHSTSSRALSAGGFPVSPHSPAFSTGSASSSSSNISLNRADQEDATITAKPSNALSADRASKVGSVSEFGEGRQSIDDLQILTISTHLTELSYTISDIQTRIFEIQELRHRSQSGGGASSSGVLDSSLTALDERLEAVSTGLASIAESIAPLVESQPADDDESERAMLIRKHAAFMADWEAVQEESEVLREELKEDKWLTVFRTVTDQADGMMSSLEKAVNRCQDFIWQVQKAFPEDSMSPSSSLASVPSQSSIRSDKGTLLSLETYQTLLDSFEAKKKHYMPTTTKVLGIIDKGVQDRVTKNGECLRRHGESTSRWKALRERITRTDEQMAMVRRILEGSELAPSEASSTTSGPTSKSKNRSGYLTPPSADSSVAGTNGKKSKSGMSRSISKMARNLKSSLSGRPTPTPVQTPTTTKVTRQPSSEPTRTLRNRKSMLLFGGPAAPTTPQTPGHKYSQSMTPESSPSAQRVARAATETGGTLRGRASTAAGTLNKQPWNSSTKVQDDGRGTMRHRRPSSSMAMNEPPPMPTPGASPYKRSASRTSMSGSSRPFSPGQSTSTTPGSHTRAPSRTFNRPPSRSQYAIGSYNPGRVSRATTPQMPTTPSRFRTRTGVPDDDDEMALMQRAFSPPPNRAETPGGTRIPHARPPSRSMIPAPVFQFSSPSRPGSAMDSSPIRGPPSDYFARAMSPTGSTATSAGGALSPRSAMMGLPPSSFRDGPGGTPSGIRVPSSLAMRSPSRSLSRASAAGALGEGAPTHVYTPGNPRDPLDAEVAAIVNSVAHTLLVERVDPPLRNNQLPKEGEEQQAQYALSSSLSRKVVTCRLTTLARPGSTATKKVMVRVGGGWKDLQMYMHTVKL
ncbi:hypothetical protein PENSPDRAFT_23549 [Peniophora sp. CONT]|nr:hypothetical protein PENSPDRAFT_23549 [Peniophora sp. CONT]